MWLMQRLASNSCCPCMRAHTRLLSPFSCTGEHHMHPGMGACCIVSPPALCMRQAAAGSQCRGGRHDYGRVNSLRGRGQQRAHPRGQGPHHGRLRCRPAGLLGHPCHPQPRLICGVNIWLCWSASVAHVWPAQAPHSWIALSTVSPFGRPMNFLRLAALAH